MTYSHEKMPWMMAHRIDLFALHEMAIASAVPNPTPIFATPKLR